MTAFLNRYAAEALVAQKGTLLHVVTSLSDQVPADRSAETKQR
jgi:hypothetical protein